MTVPTVQAPPMPETAAQRLRWALADAWTVTGRDLAHWARQPATLVLDLLFTVMVVLMFGYLFGGAMTVPGGGELPRVPDAGHVRPDACSSASRRP